MEIKTLQQCLPYQIGKTWNCKSYSHPVFRSLSKGIIPCDIVDLLCLWKEVSSGPSSIFNPLIKKEVLIANIGVV